MLWYALYAWDEALENLYGHICWLESRVLVTNDIHLTRELHIIRASLLHYASLLESFRKAVVFLRNTANPAMQDHPELTQSTQIMNRECDTLLSEIERLEMSRGMQEMRLENINNLAFASVNFEDSRYMQRLSEAAFRDGAAMKQISYLTMIFLPASFVAALFGMNINSLQDSAYGTWAHYFELAIPLTAVTVWITVALHSKKVSRDESDNDLLYRLQWPLHSAKRFMRHSKRVKAKEFEGVV
jgi:Mg2+ and Co2+ transporter CorA